ncbi:molecular chaperone TorD family protein [Prosthecomicrobium sp. N25]|uniref:molecular chaperone TorD family protein n=1 Tax=Prosthecomicrobium sp. N25 TaxID=3129254 RepID=UPI00307834E1
MRDEGLKQAIEAAGGVGMLARALGIAQPSVSNWSRVPAERVISVELVSGIDRSVLRPDLYPVLSEASEARGMEPDPDVDPLDRARGEEYLLLATLLRAAPSASLLRRLARLAGDDTALGRAHAVLADAAARADADDVETEYFDLFIGVGRGEVLPYASYYLTGFLNERPLAKVRADMTRLGIVRSGQGMDPEDHAATLCEIMSGLLLGLFQGGPVEAEAFRARHLAPWAPRLFADIARAPSARFYKAVAEVARVFFEIEAEASGLD